MSVAAADQVDIPQFDKDLSKADQLSTSSSAGAAPAAPAPQAEIKPTPETRPTLEAKTPPPPPSSAEPQQQQQQQQPPQAASSAPSVAFAQPPTTKEEAPQGAGPKVVQEEQLFQQKKKVESDSLAEAPRGGRYLFGNSDYISSQRQSHTSLLGFGCIALRGGGALNFQGSLVVPKSVTLTMICQATSLDFSRATFVHPVTTVTVVSSCASVRIIVPRGVQLQTSGLSVCANFGGPDDMDNNFPLSFAPVLKVRNYGVCARTSVELNYLVDPLVIVKPVD
ncbi:hypothetical protein BASA81_002524 [Batrachochytrium salamandrivorans]|nr:hypothetical protein BASA81_002524 [Batrachochytrium salamandrivorans]